MFEIHSFKRNYLKITYNQLHKLLKWTAITAEIVTHLPSISILHYTAVCFVLFHIRSPDSSATRRGGGSVDLKQIGNKGDAQTEELYDRGE
ncbi:hypothetical protein R1flu_024962 [Riccia fluitans]|uniref:Uncharacterized protein n=1 Tax=Riccia fluitans TaxID=41844 RepID=A0ABD1XWS8_9MARC